MIFGYFGLAAFFYFLYGSSHSVGNQTGWSALLEETNTRNSDDFDYSSEHNPVSAEASTTEARASLSGRYSADYNSSFTVRLVSASDGSQRGSGSVHRNSAGLMESLGET
jgi:hypothetical protein